MADKGAAELFITPRARQDLEQIWLYTAEKWSPDQADLYTGKIADIFDTLCLYPEMAGERREFRPAVRIHPHGSHLIIYRFLDRNLEVVRVLHSRQRWQDVIE